MILLVIVLFVFEKVKLKEKKIETKCNKTNQYKHKFLAQKPPITQINHQEVQMMHLKRKKIRKNNHPSKRVCCI